MTRVEKLERAVKAALRLRRSIEMHPERGPKLKALLVPREALEKFDATMEELKNEADSPRS